MKIYKTQAEVEKDITDGVLSIKDSVTFECSISIDADIAAYDIRAHDIKARNINAYDINANDIFARNINAYDINANDIFASDINANDIVANDIVADDISYQALCLSYNYIKCASITPRRTDHQEPICLDGKLILPPKEQTSNPKEITIDGAVYVLKEGSKR